MEIVEHIAALAVAGLLLGCASEHEPPAREATTPALGNVECTEISVHCGATPTLAFDPGGRLWAAFAQQGHVYVTSSDDLGATFEPTVRVHAAAENIETNGENRPKIAFGDGGVIYLSWTQKTAGRFTGDIRFSRSLDSGTTFEAPRTVNDDGLLTGHRFDSLHVDADGDVYLTWIDKRDRQAARSRGEDYRGAALYYTVSSDGGATFAANRQVADFACECCRIAACDAPEGGAAVLWRHIFDVNTRDHAFAILGKDRVTSPIQRATRDDWNIDACPHHGPAMTPDGENGYHTTWFTAAGEKPVVYYGRFDPVSGEMRQQVAVTTGAVQAHPHLLAAGNRLLLAWKHSDGETTSVYLKTSSDAGAAWDEGRAGATTRGKSDHPFLLGRGAQAFLAWHTASEGLRVLPVP